jgi:hypothetical protein
MFAPEESQGLGHMPQDRARRTQENIRGKGNTSPTLPCPTEQSLGDGALNQTVQQAKFGTNQLLVYHSRVRQLRGQ